MPLEGGFASSSAMCYTLLHKFLCDAKQRKNMDKEPT